MEADVGTSNVPTSAIEQRKRAKDGILVVEDAPRVKRQRVSRACDQCRAGREKCDGIKPKCGTCAFSDRACSYDTQAKKRGIQPGYIRTLELTLAWIFAKFPDAETTLKRELATQNSQVQRLLSSKEGSDSDRLHVQWSKGSICKQIDQLLSGAEVASPSQFASDSNPAISSDVLKDIFPVENETSLPADDGEGPASANGLDFFPIAAKSSTPGRPGISIPELASDLTFLHLPGDFWRLLDIYYSFTHSWLPISEKHDILKAAYSYPLEGLRIHASDTGSGNHAELWAVLSLAAHQANPRKQQDEIDAYMATTRNLLPTESGPFELGHVRALILLSLIHMARGDHTPAWLLVGLAIRVAHGLRLHEKFDAHLPRGKHVFLACYAVEAILGKLYGMTCHLRGQGLDPTTYLEEDGLEEWNPWDGGIIVTPQQSFGMSRKPAQSMSVFNRLLAALREAEFVDPDELQDLESGSPRRTMKSGSQFSRHAISDTQAHAQSHEQRPSELMQSRSRAKSRASEDNDVWNPQQLHLETVTLWLQAEKNIDLARGSWTSFTQNLGLYIQFFGSSRIPPATVILLERLAILLALDTRDMTLRNTLVSLSHIWRQEPIQAIAFQSTPGQDASPASVLGDALGSTRYSAVGGLQHHSMIHAPTYSGVLGTQGGYTSFPITQDSYQPQSSGLTSQLTMSANLEMAPSGNLMPPPPAMQHSSISSLGQSTDYMSLEHSQTADLEAIFEEIATLDGNRQSGDRPEFMRNLGLGPDLDLSAFFGTDYQSSDPLYSYLQPDSSGNGTDNQNIYNN